MFKTITFAASLLVGGLALSSVPASAAPFSANAPAAATSLESVQYGYGERRYERRREGVRPGRVVRDLLGVGPRRRDRGYYRGGRDRGYGYGRRDRF